jgi:LysM repeat protein
MKRLKKLNKIDHLFIKANSSIKIPFSTKIPKKEIVFKKLLSNNTKDRDDLFKYVIQKGDTLFTLSLKFNNKISTIKKLNPKIGYDLKAGKTILLKR